MGSTSATRDRATGWTRRSCRVHPAVCWGGSRSRGPSLTMKIGAVAPFIRSMRKSRACLPTVTVSLPSHRIESATPRGMCQRSAAAVAAGPIWSRGTLRSSKPALTSVTNPSNCALVKFTQSVHGDGDLLTARGGISTGRANSRRPGPAPRAALRSPASPLVPLQRATATPAGCNTSSPDSAGSGC